MARIVPGKIVAILRTRAAFSCEYCKVPEQLSGFEFEVDHIISRIHGGNSEIDNLAWACQTCNSYKGTNLSSINRSTGKITRLFHPTNDDWLEHFRLKEGVVIPTTAIGRVTESLLQFNPEGQIIARRIYYHLGYDVS